MGNIQLRTRSTKRGIYRASAVLTLVILVISAAVTPPGAAAQMFKVLHTFTGPDGISPQAGLTMDRAGNLYGTTASGGLQNCPPGPPSTCGTVFELIKTGPNWTFATLYKFQDKNDGFYPTSTPTIGSDGTLYGTTYNGFNGPSNTGTVFKLNHLCAASSCVNWKKTTIYRFANNCCDGTNPAAGVTLDNSGNLYGTTYSGPSIFGTVFKLSPEADGSWTESVLYRFHGLDGNSPNAPVLLDQYGDLLGTTISGGTTGGGTVYQLTPVGNNWTEAVLHSFDPFTEGDDIYAGLTPDQAGNLYGATNSGSTCCPFGSVFELSPAQGGGWNLSQLYIFQNGQARYVYGNVVLDSAGNIYGVGWGGGKYYWGQVFKLTPTQNGWSYTDLHDFADDSDGANPYGLLLGPDGNLYGTAAAGGSGQCGALYGCGTVWEIELH